MESNLSNEIVKDFKELAKEYNFKTRNSTNGIALCAKNTDRRWADWIIYNSKDNSIVLIGNTDQCNFWFCDTRPDLTPERLIDFTADLNKILEKLGDEVKLKTLVDPEDWQEIAHIHDAYDDPRYSGRSLEEEEEL